MKHYLRFRASRDFDICDVRGFWPVLLLACCVLSTSALVVMAREPGGPEVDRPPIVNNVDGVDFYHTNDVIDAEQISADAKRACSEDEYDEAIRRAEENAARNKRNQDAYEETATKAAKDGDTDKAEKAAEQANLAAYRRSSWLTFAEQLRRAKAERMRRCALEITLRLVFPWAFTRPPPPKHPLRDLKVEPLPPPLEESKTDEKSEREPKLIRTRRVSLGPTDPAPGGQIDPRDRPQLAGSVGMIGGNIGISSVGVGTQFDATLGKEREIIFTPRNLTFAGAVAEVEAPLSRLLGDDVPSIFSQMSFYAQLKGYSMWGHANGVVPVGANNVAFTNLFPNPATGTTGVLAGATGQSIDVKVNGEALQLTAGLKWAGPRLSESPRITTMLGFGAAYEYWDMGQEISQQSLTFANVSSRTKLRVDEHFFAPYLSAGVRVDDGRLFGSIMGFVAPGFIVTDASARQTNICGPCGLPGDRNFTLTRDFSDTRFSLKTGFNLNIGARLTETVTVQAGMKYVHTSETGFLRPPTTPNEQPVRLDFGSRNLFGGFVQVKVGF
jgi:hypothetical protein